LVGFCLADRSLFFCDPLHDSDTSSLLRGLPFLFPFVRTTLPDWILPFLPRRGLTRKPPLSLQLQVALLLFFSVKALSFVVREMALSHLANVLRFERYSLFVFLLFLLILFLFSQSVANLLSFEKKGLGIPSLTRRRDPLFPTPPPGV